MKWGKAGYYCLTAVFLLGNPFMPRAEEPESYTVHSTQPGLLCNHFTFGKIGIELKEPSYQEGQIILPGETIRKDPVIVNTGEIEVYAFLEILIPMAKIRTSSSPYTTPSDPMELLSFSLNDMWEVILREQVTSEESAVTQMRYVLGCKEGLKTGEQTAPAFTQLTAADYLEGELADGETIIIPVSAHAIQAEGHGSCQEAWERYREIQV